MAFDLSSARNLTDEELKEFNNNEKSKKIYGTRQALLQGASFGQAPHIWGGAKALGGATYNLLNKQNPLKDIKKDYVEGREDFKKEYNEFADKNKALAIGGDIAGGILTGGYGSKAISLLPKARNILIASKIANSPIAKAALTGAAFGGGYGASNTMGKGFDLGGSLLGAASGAAGGAALGKIAALGGNSIKKLLANKQQQLLENGKVIPQLENKVIEQEQKVIPQIEGKEQKLLENMKDIPENVIDVTPKKIESQKLPENIQSKINPLSRKEKALNSLKTGYQMDATDVILPRGMQNKNFRAFMETPEIQYEASKGLLGRKWETYQNQAADEFRNMNKEIKNFVSNAYADIPDDTVILFGKENPIAKAQEKINELTNKKITVNQAAPLKKAQDLLFMIQSTLEKQPDGQLGLNFGNIKDATQQFNALAEFYTKKDNRHAANMFKDIYRLFADLRDTNELAKRATERYRDFKSINKTLGEIGMDVEKTSNNNNVETRIMTNSRGRAGEKMNRALDKVLKVLEKYPELKQFENLKNKVRLAQVAYDVRPAANDKLLSWSSLAHPLKTLDKATQKEAQDELQVLGYRLLTGKIKPEDFKNVDMFRGGDSTNSAYYRTKAYGNILDTLRSKNLNKDVIEAAYSKYKK